MSARPFQSNNITLVKDSGVAGSFSTVAALVASPTPTYAGNQIIESNISAKLVTFGTLQALVSAQPLLIGWSTSANQGGAIGVRLDAFATELATPGTDYPSTFENCVKISTPQELNDFLLEWDGVDPATTIKSIAVRAMTATYTVDLRVVQ